MNCLRLTLALLVSLLCLLEYAPALAGAQTPTVTSDIVDASGAPVTGGSVVAGTSVQLRATVGGAGSAPSGTVALSSFPSGDCSGTPSVGDPIPLATVQQAESLTADISNDSGWDSATTWIANGVDQFAQNWYGGLFAGNDNLFFGASSMGWRFTNLPLKPGDTVTNAYLSLRIWQSRPSLASEGTWTWKTVLATDTQSGADFEGETRPTFLSRFNARGAGWQKTFSADGTNPDPFGNNDGATYAASPSIADLVTARIANPGWTSGGAIVLGLLDDGTAGTAEADVDAQPDYARLHLEWTTTVAMQTATSALFQPPTGSHSYQAQYSGDADYAAAVGPCMSLNVTAAPPSVGGIATMPDLTSGRRSTRSGNELLVLLGATLAGSLFVIAAVAGWWVRSQRRG